MNVPSLLFSPFGDLLRWPWPGTYGLAVPVHFPALSAMAAVFTCDADSVSRLLPDPRMKVVRVMPRRCLVNFVAVEYHDSELGPYKELGITIPIAFDAGALPALQVAGQALTGALSAYVLDLRVTTERARDAGVQLARFPKHLAEVSFHEEGRRLHCSVTCESEEALSLYCPAGDSPGERQLKLRCYTVIGRIPVVSNIVIRQKRFREHLRPGATSLEIGRGRLADTLRDLDPGERALASHYCSRAEALLFPPRNPLDDN